MHRRRLLVALGCAASVACVIVVLRRPAEESAHRVSRRTPDPQARVAERRTEPSADCQTVQTFHKNGELKSKVTLRTLPNGIRTKDGPWEYWNEDGVQVASGRYRDGKRDGLWRWWDESGRPTEACEYVSGKRHGAFVRWSERGRIEARGRYATGLRDGRWTWWHDDGAKAAIEHYRAGVLHGELVQFHPNGNLAERVEWVDGRAQGVWAMWDEKGQPVAATGSEG